MPERRLDDVRVAILVTDGFEQSEMTEPRRALDAAGANTVLIAPKTGEVQGFKHFDRGDSFKVDLPLEKASPNDFDAVLLPGGALNADMLRVNERAQEFVRQIDSAGKPIAVICHGPWLLVSAGLCRGRKLTSYHTIQDDLRNAGCDWQNAEVVRDQNWVSSRNPDDIPAFNRAVIELFDEVRVQRTKAA